MEPFTIPLYAAALALLANAAAYFFKKNDSELSSRISALEKEMDAVTHMNGRHDEALERLTRAVEKLTDRFERWTERGSGQRSIV